MYSSPEINRDLIVQIKFGSHLYGTDTPTSDTDYKGVFMPQLYSDLILARLAKVIPFHTKAVETQKNTPDDVDNEFFSLHEFINLACEGQIVALDMLHAPKNMLIHSSWVWDEIVKERSRFYTRNLSSSFTAYARKQASKYGIKGSKLNTAKEFLALLNWYPDDAPISEFWDTLPSEDDYIHYPVSKSPIRHIQICGKTIQETFKVGYTKTIIQKLISAYGQRAEQASRNEGIDWKAVSHAMRASFQMKEILTEGNITFPLREAQYIKDIKAGKFDYSTSVAPKLEGMIAELDTLYLKSNLPETADRAYWDEFIIRTVKHEYGFH
jgi:hypothetical protein